MSQRNIKLFFPVISKKKKNSPPPRCYLLELPFKIRRQIYHEAGLPSDRTIHINYWPTAKRDEYNGYPHDLYDMYPGRHPPIPTNLFPVCRAVYDELTPILYGENRLAITRRGPRGLRFLERLTDASILRLRFLVIRLNLCCCDGQCCGSKYNNCGYCNCTRPGEHDEPLDHSLLSHQKIILQWEKICSRLASLLQPGTLSLYVICDSANLITARKVTQSLIKLPLLKDHALRLANYRKDDLLSLAKATVLHLTAHTIPALPVPFNFPALPKEIQLRIMDFSGLPSYLDVTDDRLDSTFGCPLGGQISGSRRPMLYLMACYCERGHSAFNTLCRCPTRGFQASYFLVSKEFREMAMRTMYGRSEITISADYFFQLNSTDLGAFHRFPKDAIRFFTHLVLHFHSRTVADTDIESAALTNWTRAIAVLKAHINPVVLDLEIRFTEPFYICVWSMPELKQDIIDKDPDYVSRMLDVYARIIEPVQSLKGLKRFAVHLNWNTSCGIPGGHKWKNGEWSIPYPDGREREERRLEEMVMGEGYNAWEHGKEIAFDLRDEIY